jgi:hypothetical protein
MSQTARNSLSAEIVLSKEITDGRFQAVVSGAVLHERITPN